MSIDKASVSEAASILQTVCHKQNKTWWTDLKTGEDIKNNPLTFSNKLLLIVTEIAEACEADRKDLMDDKVVHRKGREVELADAVIRIFDLAGGFNLDLSGAIIDKLEYNSKRADHKPENRIKEGGKSY